jgi:hypothetical protein
LSSANTRGVAWPGYAPGTVTAVRPGTATTTLTLVNVGTGDTYDQSTASGAGLWVAAEAVNPPGTPTTSGAAPLQQATIVTSSDGRLWNPAAVIPFDRVKALAWGNGTWIAAVADGAQVTSPLLESTDLHTWTLVTTLPDLVQGIAYGNGRWTAVGTLISNGHLDGVVWGSTDGVHWVRVATTSAGQAIDRSLVSVAYGGGQWVATARTDASSLPARQIDSTFSSIDGNHWVDNGGSVKDAAGGPIAYGAGRWAIATSTQNQTPDIPRSQAGVVDVSSDGRSWVSRPIVGIGRSAFSLLAYGNGGWLAASYSNDSVTGTVPNTLSTTFFASRDATNWSPVANVAWTVQAVAFGGASTLNGTETRTSPTTTTPSGTSTGSTPPSSTPSPAAANVGTTFAGNWGAHERSLVIDKAGTGRLIYPDMRLCPNCSFANAPLGTLAFVLTSVTNGVATGHVTATSDPKNSAIGAAVHLRLTAGSPGQLLEVDIGGKRNFCNQTSAGQCGA